MKLSREEREHRQKLHEEMNRAPPPLIEKDEEVLKKLLSKFPYTAEDIQKCAEPLLKEYDQDFSQQFAIVETVDGFVDVVEKFNNNQSQPFFFMYNKEECCWVLFCLVSTKKQQVKMLVKDPFSNCIDKELEKSLRAKLGDVKFVVHCDELENQKEDNETMSGPICLRNLKTLLECLQVNPKKTVENFEHLKFCTPADINEDRHSRIMPLTNQISKNHEFLVKLREYVNLLPVNFDAGEEREADDYELEILNDFPLETETVHILLQIIGDTVGGIEILQILKNICDILGLDFSKIESFFPLKTEEVGSDEENDPSFGKVSEEDIISQEKKVDKEEEELSILKCTNNAEGDNISKTTEELPSTEKVEGVPTEPNN